MARDESDIVTYAVSEYSLNKAVLQDSHTPSCISKHKFRSIKAGVWLFATGPIFLLAFYNFAPYNTNTSCLANGDFIPVGGTGIYIYNTMWDLSLIVDITLGWGQLPFAVAKVIDVIFDVIVGRGGQALAAWISYSILGKALLHSMETTPTSFDRFTTTSYKIGSLTALWADLRELFSKRATRKKRSTWTLIATIYVCIYLICFSTIISAISGYQAFTTAYVTGPDNGTLINYDDLQRVVATVKDGSRIGLTDDYHLIEPKSPMIEDNPARQLWYDLIYLYYNRSSVDAAPMTAVHSGLLCPDPPGYFTQVCGPLDQSSNITVYGKRYDLDPPSLSITYTDRYYMDDNALFMHNGTVLTLDWVNEHGSCQPTSVYEWGFSFLGLLLFSLYTSSTTLILYFVWRDTYWHCRSPRTEQGIGSFRAALDLSRSLRAELGEECESCTDAELSSQIKATGAEMRLVGDESRWEMNRRELQKLAKKERKERKKGSMGIKLLTPSGGTNHNFVR